MPRLTPVRLQQQQGPPAIRCASPGEHRPDEQRAGARDSPTWLSSALVALKFFLLMFATSCRTCAKTTCPKLTTMPALQPVGQPAPPPPRPARAA